MPLVSLPLLRFHEDDTGTLQLAERPLAGHSGAVLLPMFEHALD